MIDIWCEVMFIESFGTWSNPVSDLEEDYLRHRVAVGTKDIFGDLVASNVLAATYRDIFFFIL